MMGRNPLPVLLLLLALVALTGCQRRYAPATGTVEIDPAEYDRMYQASIDVLRDNGFRVDRRDYRFGRVTTEPIASPTAFEPWVNHNTTPTQTAQSTLDHLRRTVTVSLEPIGSEEIAAIEDLGESLEHEAEPMVTASPAPADAGSEGPVESRPYRLRVEVLVENQQIPVRRLNGSVTGSRFSELAAVPSEWSSRNMPPVYWQPIGRDAHLEQRLARQIVERAMQLPE